MIQMSPREKTMAMLVGGVLVSLVTFLLVETLMKHHRGLREQIATKELELGTMKSLIAERDLWSQRDAWLTTNFQPADTPTREGSDLLDDVKKLTDRFSIVVEQPNIGSLTAPSPNYQEVSVTFETKSKWDNLVEFFYEAQSPTSFLVFKKLNVQIDKADKTQVKGNFTVVRWFARS